MEPARIAQLETATDQIVTHPIAFIGVYHGEGSARLDRLFRTCRPWFRSMIVVLQEPTTVEIQIAESWADQVIRQPRLGFCEASYDVLLKEAQERERWVFYVDGDEMPDVALLSSLGHAIEETNVRVSGGVRIRKNSSFILGDGTVMPLWTEYNVRLYRSTCWREAKPHSWIEGIVGDPAVWPVGFVAEYRNPIEFVRDQERYAEFAPEVAFRTDDLIDRAFARLVATLGESRATREMGR